MGLRPWEGGGFEGCGAAQRRATLQVRKGLTLSSLATGGHAEAVEEAGGYSIRVSDTLDDPAWDDFLERAPGCAYTQTTSWGLAKANDGWQPVRVVATRNGQIVAGIQLLVRSTRIGGVGLALKGPVLAESRRELLEPVLHELVVAAQERGVGYFAIQPPRGADWMCEWLPELGFSHSTIDLDHAAVVMDLSPSHEELLARMDAGRRRNIRTAEKHGVVVRRGSEADLAIFDRLKIPHAARIGYTPREPAYHASLYRAFDSRGHIALFIAECDGEPVSSTLTILFGDTCRDIERVWNGEHARSKPNDALVWEVMKWAKSEGYAFCDEGWVPQAFAEAVLAGQEPADDPKVAHSQFKLRFGGRVVIDPPGFDYVCNPVLRSVYRRVPHGVKLSRPIQWCVTRLGGKD